MSPRVSICIATFNKRQILYRTLESIRKQAVPFEYELIVVDDGGSDQSWRACKLMDATYIRVERPADYRNPAVARNLAYKAASGEVLICQSDDVLHFSPNCIESLMKATTPQNMVIASVFNYDVKDVAAIDPAGLHDVYSGPLKPYPLFFLGAVRREHIYAIGGNDEEFTEPGYEDNFFSECLLQGRGLIPLYSGEIIGVHQHHRRPSLRESYAAMKEIFDRKMHEAKWIASGGAWI